MGRTQRCRRGGILGLLALPRETWEAVEVDLLHRGFTFADVPTRVSWRALVLMIRHSPRDSTVYRVVFGEQADWGVTDHLLATIADILNLILWLTGNPKKNPKPNPLPRPGAAPVEEEDHFGSVDTSMTIEEFNAWMLQE